MKTLIKLLVMSALIATLAISARANSLLFLSDGTNSKLINDGDLNDGLGSANDILYNGSLGSWNITVTTALVGGSASNPYMHLNSIVSSTAAADLFIFFMSNNFGPSSGQAVANVGGTNAVGGTNHFAFGTNGSNALNLFWDQLYLPGPSKFSDTYAAGPFSGTGNFGVNFDGAYSMGIASWIHHGARTGGFSSFDAEVTVPDSGATALLLSVGLIGLGLAARRTKKA